MNVKTWQRAIDIVSAMSDIDQLTYIARGVVVADLVAWIEGGHQAHVWISIWGDRPAQCARELMEQATTTVTTFKVVMRDGLT